MSVDTDGCHIALRVSRLRGNHTVQAELARALLTRLPRLDREVAALTQRIGALVEGHPLLGLPGAGPITDRQVAACAAVRRVDRDSGPYRS